MKAVAAITGITLLLYATGAVAQGRAASSPIELARAADVLQPGEWVWAPEIAPTGPILIYVDLSDQLATVYRNGVRIGVTTVSTGRPGHETPTGVFSILQKDANHRSTKYNNAPMFFMERLTWDGVALHAGGLPGYPESHGCIHLPIEFARRLYGVTDFRATVVVAGDAARHIGVAPAGVATPFSTTGLPGASEPLDGAWRWTPELSAEGPTTIVLSKADQMAVVLRNGVEIGRSQIVLDDHDGAVHVFNLSAGDDGAQHWVYAGLPGHEAEAGRELESAILGRLRAPTAFYRAVRESLKVGDTVLVTPAPVGQGSVGLPVTILDALEEPTAD